MKIVYKTPKVMTDAYMTTCGGCGHGIITKLVGEVIDELGIAEDVILILPIGCSTNAWMYYKLDSFCALHGRAPAVATGMKRARPENIILAYQGDGDLVSEGMSEIMHAVVRGEKISVIFVNNTIFGMTGGQMAPTTLIGQVTSTSPCGKTVETAGYPTKMAELIASLPGCYYSERVAVNSISNIKQTKQAIKKAIQYQIAGQGLSFVEILSPCPTGWKISPVKALDWMEENVMQTHPLGVYKEPEESK